MPNKHAHLQHFGDAAVDPDSRAEGSILYISLWIKEQSYHFLLTNPLTAQRVLYRGETKGDVRPFLRTRIAPDQSLLATSNSTDSLRPQQMAIPDATMASTAATKRFPDLRKQSIF
jgi:hypothetical protein